MAASTSSAVGSSTVVAPIVAAASRRQSSGSLAMICAAPAARAPCTTESPMPPRPSTSTVAPGSTLAVLSTAPTPVCTAQPITHAVSSGVSSGTFTAPVSLVIAYSAKPPTPRPAEHLLCRRATGRSSRRGTHRRAPRRCSRSSRARRAGTSSSGRTARSGVSTTLSPGRDHGDALPHRVDDPRRLVPEHRRARAVRAVRARCSRSGRSAVVRPAPAPVRGRDRRCRRRRWSGRCWPAS